MNVLTWRYSVSLGLDIGTLIEVRRAQLAYRLSDEVTFFLSKFSDSSAGSSSYLYPISVNLRMLYTCQEYRL